MGYSNFGATQWYEVVLSSAYRIDVSVAKIVHCPYCEQRQVIFE